MTQTPTGWILGAGANVACRTVAPDVAIHWWPTAAEPGDPCLCGECRKSDPNDGEVPA